MMFFIRRELSKSFDVPIRDKHLNYATNKLLRAAFNNLSHRMIGTVPNEINPINEDEFAMHVPC
jgi:hypothetical protein